MFGGFFVDFVFLFCLLGGVAAWVFASERVHLWLIAISNLLYMRQLHPSNSVGSFPHLQSGTQQTLLEVSCVLWMVFSLVLFPVSKVATFSKKSQVLVLGDSAVEPTPVKSFCFWVFYDYHFFFHRSTFCFPLFSTPNKGLFSVLWTASYLCLGPNISQTITEWSNQHGPSRYAVCFVSQGSVHDQRLQAKEVALLSTSELKQLMARWTGTVSPPAPTAATAAAAAAPSDATPDPALPAWVTRWRRGEA